MKITIEAHGQTVTVDTNDDHSDLQTVVEALKGMLVTVGFHPVTIDNIFDSQMYDSSWELDNTTQVKHMNLDRTAIEQAVAQTI